MFNPIMATDSYKLSHFNQYPPEMTHMQSYFESRGGEYRDIIFFGIQAYLFDLEKITKECIDSAELYATAHGMPFNRAGFEGIVELGHWPIKIVGKREGAICRPNEPLFTIENTDVRFPWVVNYLETYFMKVWYAMTVASKAYSVRKMLIKKFEDIGLVPEVDYMYHNFGDRGSTSVDAACMGAMAHLISFMGTDIFYSLGCIHTIYPNSGHEIAYSIPATEHSTVTSWGKEREFTMIEHFLESNKERPMIACVLDSYNIYNSVEYVTTHLKSRIESKDYPIFVIRPDSGNPMEVIPSIFSIMETNKVGFNMVAGSNRDYKLFNKYRIIWGDGVDPQAISDILDLVISLGYSPSNISFGSGGDLMQKVNRDTCKVAIKACAVQYAGSLDWLPIYKDPIHDGFKKSKGGYQTVEEGMIYYNDGHITPTQSFHEIRREAGTIRGYDDLF